MSGEPEMPEQVLPAEGAEEVAFPWSQAGSMRDQLISAADKLAEQFATREEMVSSIADWEGIFRNDFNTTYSGLESTATGPDGLIEKLRTVAGDILNGADKANEEQTRLNNQAGQGGE